MFSCPNKLSDSYINMKVEFGNGEGQEPLDAIAEWENVLAKIPNNDTGV